MATDLKDSRGIAITPKEAEAIIELWAKQQTETDALRSRLTVEDMAEAMAVPREDVEQMLLRIRAQQSESPVQETSARKVRPVNSFLIAMAAIAWVAILIGACSVAYWRGKQAAPPSFLEAPFPPPMAMETATVADTAYAPTGTVAQDTTLSDMGSLFSQNLSVEFDGTTIKGRGTTNELQIGDLQKVVDTIFPVPSAITTADVPDIVIVKALLANDAEKVNGLIQYKKLTIRGGNAHVEEIIPVSLTQDDRILRLVREEQQKRLRILVNKAETILNF